MVKRTLLWALVLVGLLSACSTDSPAARNEAQADEPVIIVYRPPA